MSALEICPDDRLPLGDGRSWTHEKHERLKRYVGICRSVRQKFHGPGKGGATYIDLYCGPGRARIRETGELVDGSAVVAAVAAEESGEPFTQIHVGDVNPEFARATTLRLRARGVGARIFEHVGPAQETAPRVVESLNPYGLHFAFLDPFNLGDLPFSVIAAFSGLRRADLLVHVSAMDLQRNLEHAIRAGESHPFDVFAPGWRRACDLTQAQHAVRRRFVAYWTEQVRSLGFEVFEEQFTSIRGQRNQPLYWLALVARHRKAAEFWEKIRHIDPQRDLGF